MGSVVKGVFGSPSKSRQPTGFQTLPRFARRGFGEAIATSEQLAQDPNLFIPTGFTPEQEQALGVLTQAAQPLTGEVLEPRRELFFNPFVEQALEPALQDLRTQGQGLISDIGAGATAAGGFGGARQALLEAQVARDVAREAGRLGATTRAAAFSEATQRALEQLGSERQAAGTLFGLGEAQRTLEQAQRQAPLAANQFLLDALARIPTGGGGTSTGARQGFAPSILGGGFGSGIANVLFG